MKIYYQYYYFYTNHQILMHMLIYLAIFLGQYGRIGLHKRHYRFISHWNICLWRSFNCSEATLCPCGTGWSIQVRIGIIVVLIDFLLVHLPLLYLLSKLLSFGLWLKLVVKHHPYFPICKEDLLLIPISNIFWWLFHMWSNSNLMRFSTDTT